MVYVVSIFPKSPQVHEPTAAFTELEEARQFARANNANNGFSIRNIEVNPRWSAALDTMQHEPSQTK